jgi:hypothetical protein
LLWCAGGAHSRRSRHTSYERSLEAFNFAQPRSILPMRRQQLGFRLDF